MGFYIDLTLYTKPLLHTAVSRVLKSAYRGMEAKYLCKTIELLLYSPLVATMCQLDRKGLQGRQRGWISPFGHFGHESLGERRSWAINGSLTEWFFVRQWDCRVEKVSGWQCLPNGFWSAQSFYDGWNCFYLFGERACSGFFQAPVCSRTEVQQELRERIRHFAMWFLYWTPCDITRKRSSTPLSPYLYRA